MKSKNLLLGAIGAVILAIACFAQTNSIGTAGGADKQIQVNSGTGLAGISNGSTGQVMTSNGASLAPTMQNLPSPLPDTVTHATTSGAIAVSGGTVGLGSSGVLAETLATPTNPGQDGTVIVIVAETAHAHTVTTAANVIKGANTSGDTVTFAHVGDMVILEAVGGLWYIRSLNGALLSEV
jgi:hypothetical protein